MLEATGNLWDYMGKVNVVFITTNGMVRQDGKAVMGRGCALEARYPKLPFLLAEHLRTKGNVPGCLLQDGSTWVASFPTKGDWRADSTIMLITRSALWVQKNMAKDWTAVIPPPGCGNGGLRREDVLPLMHGILDDRFTVLV